MRLTGQEYTGLGLGAVLGYYGMSKDNSVVAMIGLAIFVAAGLNVYKPATRAQGLKLMDSTFIKPGMGPQTMRVHDIDTTCSQPSDLDVFPHESVAIRPPKQVNRYMLASTNLPPATLFDESDTSLLLSHDVGVDYTTDEVVQGGFVSFDYMSDPKLKPVSQERLKQLQQANVPVVTQRELKNTYMVY